MNNYLSLTKVFLKSLKTNKTNNKSKHIFRLLVLFTIIFIIVPFLIISYSFTSSTTLKLIEMSYETIGLKIISYVICIFTSIFSIFVIFNDLYFSNDIEKVLPLPVKGEQLAMAKFTTMFIIENIIQILLTISIVLGYRDALNLSFSNILLSIIPIFTITLIPMIYSFIICHIIIYFSKFIKNKENIKKISTIFICLLLVLLLFFISGLKSFDFNKYLESFVNGNHKFIDTMNIIFPHVNLFSETLTNRSIISLIEYIIINVIYVSILVLILKYTYQESIIGLLSKSSTSKTRTIKSSDIKQKNIIYSYILKDLKVLFRTPTFFINCIIINFIWPVFIYILYEIGTLKFNLENMRLLLNNSDNHIKIILLLFIFSISMILPAMNSISSTSFSREGKNFNFIKYIPISYKKQLFIKYLTSMLISLISLVIYTLIFYIIIKLNITLIIEFIILNILSVSVITLLGMYIDSLQPKIYWDDENNALRENYNTFISMGISIFILIGILLFSYIYLYRNLLLNYGAIYLIIISILVVINLLLLLIIKRNGINNLINQE